MLKVLRKYAGLLLMMIGVHAQAQLCNGSLGDPVVNITYGAGSNNPGPNVSGVNTNYTFTNVSCPPDGSYTIVNRTSNCFGGTWHDVLADHTSGDVDGYMMLVNASFQSGIFFVDTLRNLCPGNTYEFSSWMLNIIKPSSCGGNGGTRPNMTFSIETPTGAVIQTYNSGDIPPTATPIWNQYGFFFTLPTGISAVVLRIVNNAPGGCGNDILLDDITFRPCGPVLSAQIVGGGTASSIDVCVDAQQTYQLTGTVSTGYNNPSYQWQVSTNGGFTWADVPGATTTSFVRTPTAAGNYVYRLSVAEVGNIGIPACRVASNRITITVAALPVPNASTNGPVCENAEALITATGGGTYAWTDSKGNSYPSVPQLRIPATMAAAGDYYVTVTTAANCITKDTVTLVVLLNPQATASADVTICEGDATTLTATGGLSYLWRPSAGLNSATADQPTAAPTDSTLYIVTARAANGCTDEDSVWVNVLKKPVPDAGGDKKIIEGNSVVLDGSITGNGFTFFWSPAGSLNSPATLSPVASPGADTYYTLHAVANNGCGEKTDEVFVRVFKKINIPNAFSPNGDGVNDVWNIEALDTYPESVTEVYNRYGQLVFRSRGYKSPWRGTFNGSPLPQGTYYYQINRNKELPVLSGWVFILR